MTTAQPFDTPRLTFSEAELLDSGTYQAPLIAGGVRCHGGFDAERRVSLAAHRSPRPRDRAPGRRGSRATAMRSWTCRAR